MVFGKAAAHARPSRTVKFSTGSAVCGVVQEPEGGMGCFATALPSGPRRDGFIELHAHGRAKISKRGDCPFRDCGGKPERLPQGRAWSRAGVKCRHGNGVRCHNRDGHGFVLHPTSYLRF